MSNALKIGIIGTRRRDNDNDIDNISQIVLSFTEDELWLVSGGCPKGGDRFAEVIAKRYGLPMLIFYPDWSVKGNKAGFERNTDIAFHSDILIARVHPDRKGGTEDTIKKFQKMHPQGRLIIINDTGVTDSEFGRKQYSIVNSFFGE